MKPNRHNLRNALLLIVLLAVLTGGCYYWFVQSTGQVVVTHKLSAQELAELKGLPPPRAHK